MITECIPLAITVRSLLRDLNYFDGASITERRRRQLHLDLDLYTGHVFGGIDKAHREKTIQSFLVDLKAQPSIAAVTLQLITRERIVADYLFKIPCSEDAL